MFRPLSPRPARRGNTLIVTLSMLALLAVLGITAVYFAKDQAERARIQGQPGPDVAFPDNGMGAWNSFLGTLIYDAPDSGDGLTNSMRGSSMMATMYGRSRQVSPGVWVSGGTIDAWNGTGSFSEAATTAGVDRLILVNHRVFPGQGVIYDPEFRGERPLASSLGSSGAYVPKNIAYTYPDMKDFYLAAQCPATGEILFPSFSRKNGNGFGSLAPGNPNWTNAIGKFLTLRPRPAEHPNFPMVPPNADGTNTGDVQNLPGAFFFDSTQVAPRGQFVQKNDSIWIDIGLPAFTLPNGKRVKPLVAPLVLDLDGRLNLNIIGNQMAAGAHTSGAGFGPWEINPLKALPNDTVGAQQLINFRGPPINRAGINSKSFTRLAGATAGGQQLPVGSAVAWTGNAGGLGGTAPTAMAATQQSLNLPGYGGTSLYANNPVYNPLYTLPMTPPPAYTPGYDSTNAQVPNHPSLHSPSEFRYYPWGDTKALLAKYAAPPSNYATMTAGTQAPTSLVGATAFPPFAAAGTGSSYRIDLSHTNRGIFTTHSAGLDRPGLTPTTGQTQSVYAALGAIDLNRKLTDYRADLTKPLGPTNLTASVPFGTTTALQGDIDRQWFARDIFARLLVASGNVSPTVGAVVNPDGTTTITEAVGTPGYNILRNLAQLAANIIDYIDDDDICTTFVWNPANPLDPYAAANFTNINNAIVFGVEKPRLVLNEAFGEISNDPTDPAFTDPLKVTGASKAAHIRFWLELQNPSATPYAAGVGPLGTGAVKVRYTVANDGVVASYSPYQIQIVRSSSGGANVSDLLKNPANANYPSNVTGAIIGAAPDLRFDFSAADGAANSNVLYTVNPSNGTNLVPNAAGSVLVCAANVPNVTQGIEFNPAGFGGFTNVINASAVGTPFSALAYTMPLATAFPQANTAPSLDLQQHVVLLRRLANPYLLPGATGNPYITVDYMDFVPASDRVLLSNNSNANAKRTAKATAGGAGGTGYDPNTPPAMGNPDLRPRSLGKVQPYASWTPNGVAYQATTGTYNFTFPASLVLPQNPTADPGQGILHTFTRHNAMSATAPVVQTYTPSGMAAATLSDTIMTPFDWLVHLDRPLINQIELLHVTTGRPYEFTLRSVVPNGTNNDVTKFGNAAQTGFLGATPQLYRALDLLRIQPYGQLTAQGGRVHGRININTIQDKRVWDALFDAQVTPTANGFSQAQVDALWTALIQSRTLNMQARSNAAGTQLTDSNNAAYLTPIPGQTNYDMNVAGFDRPFLPLGAATVAAGGATLGAGTGIEDTILRTNGTGVPLIAVATSVGANSTSGTHPYQQAEAVRKILNNTTTVSHSFAVWATVGYFEVEAETPIAGVALSSGAQATFAQLGREYYRDVPGDTRYKFFAIVDRSQVGIDPTSFVNAMTNPANPILPAQVRPFFTTVEPYNFPTQPTTPAGTNTINITVSDAAGNVYSDGTPVQVMPAVGSLLVIGTGANAEMVTVQSVSAPVNGVVQVTISSGGTGGVVWTPLGPTGPVSPVFLKNHYPGESVSNVLPGNPGPQPSFDVNQQIFQAVVPHWSRVP